MPTTTVPVRPETLARLRSYKVGGATYDDVLNELMDDCPPGGLYPGASPAAQGGGILRLEGCAQATEAVSLGPRPDQSIFRARARPPSSGCAGTIREGVRRNGAGSEASTGPGCQAPARHERDLAATRRIVPGGFRDGGGAGPIYPVWGPQGHLPGLWAGPFVHASRSCDSP